MNAILAFIPKPVLAGIVLALVIASAAQSCTIRKQAGEVAKATVAVAQAKTTNVANLETILDLSVRLRDSVDERTADEEAHTIAVAKWTVERELLETRANDIQTESIEVYRDPTCADLAKTNVTFICPDFVRGMRKRADRVNRVRDDRGLSPGTDAAIE
jgi:hypothetical protein